MTISFVLVHSPLVGPVTWEPVRDELRRRGHAAALARIGSDELPLWSHHAEEIAAALLASPGDPVLVAHSGAGVLLPEAGRRALRPVAGYIFVDAQIPIDGRSRIDLWRGHEPELVAAIEECLAAGERGPFWDDVALRAEVPDVELRGRLQAEVQPRGSEFYGESIEVFEGWPDAPCGYLQLTDAYEAYASEAEGRGWSVRRIDAGHFHMMVDPPLLAELLEEIAGDAIAG
ncbi:MAG: alpha/beta fold hydrolase [Actinomycetota bacterium]|nr:alpha/beta fold hydrolase [Actinomycetota bacterium]